MLILKIGKRHMMEGMEQLKKKKSEYSEKRKLTSTWKYWKPTTSNKKKIKKGYLKENEKTTRNQI